MVLTCFLQQNNLHMRKPLFGLNAIDITEKQMFYFKFTSGECTDVIISCFYAATANLRSGV